MLVGGDYVTADSGTGLVHSAPGHGQEDYMVRYSRLSFHIPGIVIPTSRAILPDASGQQVHRMQSCLSQPAECPSEVKTLTHFDL